MQTGKEQLARQQLIMKLRGFYSGAIDGIWGPQSIDAKKKWELSGSKFTPGLPNQGLPFDNKGPYPKGIRLDRATGLLTCAEVDIHIQSQAKAQSSKQQDKTNEQQPE